MIKAAAIKIGDKLYTSHNHAECIAAAVRDGQPKPIRGEQGFLTTAGKFLDRAEALNYAKWHGQLKLDRKCVNYLFSEDVAFWG